MLISHLYYYLLYFIAVLETLRNISCMNFVKQLITCTCSSRILRGFPQSHGGHIWYYGKGLDALFRILAVGIPTDVNLSQ